MKLLAGIIIGLSLANIYSTFKYTTLEVPKYKVGDCLSNGMYFEKIVGIRQILRKMSSRYETIAYFGGTIGIRPDTTETWIVDENYTLVEPSRCRM